jgi:hypothetical protein
MNWLPILTRSIPAGGFGRSLTATECRRLRAQGYRLSRRWIVVRHADRDHLGIVYQPSRRGGYDHAGIYVTNERRGELHGKTL